MAQIVCAIVTVLGVTAIFAAADRYLGLSLDGDAVIDYAIVAAMGVSAAPSLGFGYDVIAIKYRLPF